MSKKTITTFSEELSLRMEEIEDKVANLELPEPSSMNQSSNTCERVVQEKCNIQEGDSVDNMKSKKCFVENKELKPVHFSRNTVLVKKNAATILREASRVIVEEEKEIRRLYDLVNGGLDYKQYELQHEEKKLREKSVELQEIQKKHLLGLLSREEAIIAKHRIQQANKVKRVQIDKEKIKAKEIADRITLEHNERVKNIVEKTQQIQKNITQQKQILMEKRHKEAQEVSDTNKQMYQEYIFQQKEELEEKIQLIKQIREFTNIKYVDGITFDPTETMNLGLLCEMSLNELKERLQLNKSNFKKHIENRKHVIAGQKHKQQQFLKDTQKFIYDCREQRKKINIPEKQMNKSTDSKEVVELREKLLAARCKRALLECSEKNNL